MADPTTGGTGAEQLRYKTILETEKDLLSIERQLNQLNRDRLVTQSDEIKGNKTLQGQLKAIFAKQEDILLRRTITEQKLALAAEAYRKNENDRSRRAAERLYNIHKRRLKQMSVEMEVEELKLGTIKDELEYQQKIEQVHDTMVEKVIAFLGKSGEVFKHQSNYYKILKSTSVVSKSIMLLWASIAAIVTTAFELFKSYDSAFAKFRLHMGMLRKDSERFRIEIRNIGTEFAHLGVTFDGVGEAIAALGAEFGGTARVSKDLTETVSVLKAQLGVAEANSAGFLRNISALSKTTAQAQRHMVYYANALTAAAGIPMDQVMADVAKASSSALAMVSRMPGQIVKTAVAARTLGTSLNRMADASRHILNFTESVQQEMEASVLIGQGVNLQLARELAYRRDIEGSTRAILREAKRLKFEQMDVFQMEAFASATGRSADEIFRMLQAERQLDEARNIDGLKDEVREYERLKALREGDLKNSSAQRENTVKLMANQERLMAIQQQFNKLLLDATATFFPLIDFALRFTGELVKVGPLIASGVYWLKKAYDWVYAVSMGTTAWAVRAKGVINTLIKVKNFFGIIFNAVAGVVGKITGLTGIFSRLSFLTPFLKVVPVLGWIITAFQLISSGMKWWTAWRKGEVSGWQAIGNTLRDVFLKPFMDAWDWIKGIFGPGSASVAMKAVIQGIIGGVAQLYDAITSPFRNAFAWILDKVPFVGKSMGDKLRGGMTEALQDFGILEKKVTPKIEAPAKVSVETPSTPVSAAKMAETVTAVSSATDQQNTGLLQNIAKSLDSLNANLMSGKVAVYIDGQLATAIINRNLAHMKPYGNVA